MMEEKVALFPPNIAQKVATHFLQYSDIIRNSPKSHQNMWATFMGEFVAKNLKKSPNLVTLSVAHVIEQSQASKTDYIYLLKYTARILL